MFHVFELDDFGDWCWVTTFPREDAAQMLVNIGPGMTGHAFEYIGW